MDNRSTSSHHTHTIEAGLTMNALVSLHAEAFATATGSPCVGIDEFEARAGETIHVVHLGTHQVQETLWVYV